MSGELVSPEMLLSERMAAYEREDINFDLGFNFEELTREDLERIRTTTPFRLPIRIPATPFASKLGSEDTDSLELYIRSLFELAALSPRILYENQLVVKNKLPSKYLHDEERMQTFLFKPAYTSAEVQKLVRFVKQEKRKSIMLSEYFANLEMEKPRKKIIVPSTSEQAYTIDRFIDRSPRAATANKKGEFRTDYIV